MRKSDWYLAIFCLAPSLLGVAVQWREQFLMVFIYFVFTLIFFSVFAVLIRNLRHLMMVAVIYSFGAWLFFAVLWRHHGVPVALLIDILHTSSVREAVEYLHANRLFLAVFVLMCCLVLAMWCVRQLPTYYLPKAWRKNLLALNLMSLAVGLQWDYLPWAMPPFPSPVSDLGATRIYPVAVAKLFQSAYLRITQSDRLLQDIVVKRQSIPEQEEIHVLVIGESSRFDRWQINGYARATSPKLAQIPSTELLNFKRVHGGANLTILAVPILLTGSLPEKYESRQQHVSILDYVKKAGFMTAWLSSQDEQIGGRAEVKADVLVTRNNNMGQPKYLFERLPFDEELLPLLDQVLESTYPKKFIVLHTTGNHMDYHLRYPANFAQFSSQRDLLYTQHQELQDSYDNSILYVDWFLDQVIAKLKARNVISSMSFIADHGDDLYDKGVSRFGHGSSDSSQFEQHIPYFMWGSAAFRSHYAAQWEQLRTYQQAALGAENYMHTMLDLLTIQYPNKSIELSLVRPEYRIRPNPKVLANSGNLVEVKVP